MSQEFRDQIFHDDLVCWEKRNKTQKEHSRRTKNIKRRKDIFTQSEIRRELLVVDEYLIWYMPGYSVHLLAHGKEERKYIR